MAPNVDMAWGAAASMQNAGSMAIGKARDFKVNFGKGRLAGRGQSGGEFNLNYGSHLALIQQAGE
jgi:hypothetical protein